MGRQKLLDRGIRRIRGGGGRFQYVHADGRRVSDAVTLTRIQSLGIPPAWTDVAIATRAGERLQAVGRDGSGKWQYRYHDKIVAVRAAAKYQKMVAFGERLGAARWTISRHLRLKGLPREKVCAAMVRLLNSACFRIGGDDSAKKNRTYGISTLRPRHVHFSGDTVTFEYRGKWGKKHSRSITDKRLRKVVQACHRLKGKRLFQYLDEEGKPVPVTSRDLNRYIKDVFGPDYSAKDFRTWAGTVIAAWQLARLGPATGVRQIKRNILAAVDEVATSLGNTRAIARSSYIAPRIFHHYEEGKTIVATSSHLLEHFAARQRSLTRDEQGTLRLLRRKPKIERH